MSLSITITGTGCPIPDPNRAGPGALVRYDDLALRLAGADVWIPDLSAVFITHHHSDHVTGLADLVLTRWVMDRDTTAPPLPIVAPHGPSADFASALLDGWDADIEVRRSHMGRHSGPHLEVVPFDVPDIPCEVWRRGDVSVSAGQVRHEPCERAVGYRIDTPGGSVAITGDTRVCDEVAQLAYGVDVLVYEAMRFSFFEDLPPHRQFVTDYHADTGLIGAQAAALNVPELILTHLIPAPRTEEDRQAYVDDIRRGGYDGKVTVADDLHTSVVGSV